MKVKPVICFFWHWHEYRCMYTQSLLE